MLASDVIDRARDMLADNTGTPRWTDAQLLELLNDGQQEVWSRRNDVRWSSAGVYQSGGVTAATATSDALDIDVRFRAALANYISYRAFEFDADDQANQSRSSRHFQIFEKELKTT
jgi:hypothetical protein